MLKKIILEDVPWCAPPRIARILDSAKIGAGR